LSEARDNHLPVPVSAKLGVMARRLWRMLPLPLRVRWFAIARLTLDRALRLQRVSIDLERHYQSWIDQHDTPTEADIQAIKTHIARLVDPPKFSVLMPVFNPAPGHLRAAIASVRTQFYPHWELCIADDASTDPEVVETLARAAAEDGRIKLVRRQVNGHISAASNSALELASGLFVAFLDHDDLLAPNALYEIAAELAEHPDADILYSDEDHIGDDGRRSTPYFKVGWNPELLLGQNFINHLAVYRLTLLRQIGGLRVGLEGSQDYDLALRASARTTPAQIRHIPVILYHWRRTSQAGSFSEASLDRCIRNARAAIGDHLKSMGSGARVEPAAPLSQWSRVIRPIPDPPPLVSVIVPTRDKAAMLKRCVKGVLQRTSYRSVEVLIIDNGSTQAKTFKLFKELCQDERVRVLPFPGPFNYSAMNNHAVTQARGELVLLLNNDIDVIDSAWLSEMVSQAIRPEIGAVGAKLLYRNGLVQHGGVLVGMGGVAGNLSLLMGGNDPGYFGQLMLSRNILAVTAACMLVRKAVFEAAGGLDAEALPIGFNDVDLCLRIAELGYRNVWTPYATLYHLESASRGHDLIGEKQARADREAAWMRKRWGRLLRENDDANPNLMLEHPHYRLAFPPRRHRPWLPDRR
jgi:O-antigen biosynthesis protein